jgi:DNA-binding GntR family transcriptional regulator
LDNLAILRLSLGGHAWLAWSSWLDVLDPDDERAPFRQVAERLRRQIAEGVYGPGKKLPSRKDLAEEFGVAPMTVQSALRELRAAGLIVSRRGSGVFVRTRPGRSAIPVTEIEQLIDELEDRLPVFAELSGTSTATDIIERLKTLAEEK